MSLISYAQNFEDIMLWRALGHVENGFYIDVGANDPTADSVTKLFYDRGWSGINIEPLSVHFADLERERPRDINLCCAAGPTSGEIEIWECDVRGWTTADKAAIAEHIAQGESGNYLQVPMSTLTEICQQHAPQEIHFLKIDVEGFEQSVLEGMDFGRFRPWIVVVEATHPNAGEEVHEQWESLLTTANYVFVYADGLNRFYRSQEHAELARAFKYPPNVFDDFVKVAQIYSETLATQAQARATQANAAMIEAQTWASQMEVQANQAAAGILAAQARATQANAAMIE